MSAYIFLGTELGKKQDAVNSIRELLKSKSNTEIEEFVYYADETPAIKIVDTLQNQGLFADSRLVIVKNAEEIKTEKTENAPTDVELLVSWTKNSKLNDENTVLILLSDKNNIASGFDNAKANKQIFYEMSENEKITWLKNFFQQHGYNIDNDCINTILELVENNTDALRQECIRLISFLGNKENKTTAKGQTHSLSLCEVEKWLAHNKEESAFTLFSRIAAGDLPKALESVSVMLAAKESAVGILAVLAWCFRKLNDYLALQETGNAGNFVELKKIGMSSPKAKADYISAAQRYNAETAEACLALTAEYDKLMRSPVVVMEKILMDRYIIAIINKGSC